RHHPHATLLVAPPPTSTLFPYTTLFRSVGIQPLTIDSEDFIPDIDSAVPGPGATGYAGHHDTAIVGRRVEAEIRHLPTFIVVDQDRKSTRLNSSHVKISYAVFCLKKKTK